MYTRKKIEDRLKELKPLTLVINDDSDAHKDHLGAMESGGGHFTIKLVSEAFLGKSKLERHRVIYELLDDLIPQEIHALSINAETPDEK